MSLSRINIAPIEAYVEEVVRVGATDLLVTPKSPPRVRVDGKLCPIASAAALDAEHVDATIAALLPDELLAELHADKEVDFSFSYRDTHRFRGNCFVQQGSLALSLRGIPLDMATSLTHRKRGRALGENYAHLLRSSTLVVSKFGRIVIAEFLLRAVAALAAPPAARTPMLVNVLSDVRCTW